MLDTVELCLTDCEIKQGAKLLIEPSSINYQTGELVSDFPLWEDASGGEWVRGRKAYLNNSHFNMSVKPLLPKMGFNNCFIHFSVPKIHNGENYYSVGKEGTEAVFKQVEQELSEAGIKTNIWDAYLTRVDTFKNIITEEPFLTYSSLFSILQASRLMKRDYGTTFLWGNTQQEFCVYDKLAEMEHRKLETSHYPAQTMRFEYRLTDKRKIEKTLGFSKVKEIPPHWGELKTGFKQAWEDKLFNVKVEEVEIMASEQVFSEMKYFQERYGKYYYERYKRVFGAYLIDMYVGIEPVKMAIKRLEEGNGKEAVKKKIQRATKEFEETRKEVELMRGRANKNKTLSTLYNELKDKVCLN